MADGDSSLKSLLGSLFSNKGLQKPRIPLNLTITSEDNFLAWLEDTKQLLVVSLKSIIDTDENGPNKSKPFYQKFSCSQMLPFEVNSISLSFSGQFLALSGEHGVGVMEMPKQWGNTSLYAGGKPNVICRTVILAADFFKRKFSVEVLQASWFPGSPSDIHLLVLTNDNCLRCFDVREADTPISSIKLFNDINSSSSVTLSNFATALGEMAVSFTFASPMPFHKETMVYPVILMQENGDAWTLWTRLVQNRLLVEQRGPLTMTPQAEDNYGGEFSSTLCLHTSPPVVILATRRGCLYHCIVLESEQEGDQYESDEASLLRGAKRMCTQDLELFVYETVQLDLSLLKTEQISVQFDEQINENVKLYEDKSAVHRYYCVSSGGVHLITLPWAKELEYFCLPDTNSSNPAWEISSPAEINYILCTKPTERSTPYQILGHSTISSVRDGTSFVCLLENGELVIRPISTPYQILGHSTISSVRDGTSFVCLLENGELVIRPISDSGFEDGNPDATFLEESLQNHSLNQFPSPLKGLKAAGSFDEYIKHMIKRDGNTPLIKSQTGNQNLTPEELYQILTQSAGHLRQEYIQKLSNASNEIQKRCEILKVHKEQQAADLSQILNNQELADNVERLADKLSTVAENMASLTERLDNVVSVVQSSSPVLSEAEREWSKEVSAMQQKVGNLKRCVENIRRKHENLVLTSSPRKLLQKGNKSNLNPTQLGKIKTYMNEQNNKIADLVDRVRATNLQLET